MIVEIIPAKRTNPEREIFSYSVPKELEEKIKIGSIVEIPFGKYGIKGVIFKCHCEAQGNEAISHDGLPRPSTGLGSRNDAGYELKNITSVNEQFALPEHYLKIAQWVSLYYLCSLGEAVSLFLPPKAVKSRKSNTISTAQVHESLKLNTEQAEVFKNISDRLSIKDKKPVLLHGVTGSGKTEIYLKLVEENIKNNKQAIILVPEIMLATQVVEQFKKRFGDIIALMHSNLSASERFASYQQFSNNTKSILIGPRSALLVPTDNLGLIIIDEEQEDAYKQEKSPRYHAVDLAKKIAEHSDALLLLGSATPRIEDYKEIDIQFHFKLMNRYHQMILPPAEVIDLKNEIKYKNFSPISTRLQEEIAQILKAKKQAILFINRRGTATFVSCRDCGEVIQCPHCAIPMVYHINFNSNYLNCHHCDFKSKTPDICPACSGARIKFFGTGIEKIELEVERLFPKAKIKRVDSTSMENKGEYAKLYKDLKEKNIDILIGTQIVAKGLDLPEVDLVGVISADTGLHLPNYRANEKIFQIITQVSGRSGRKNNIGKTIIQTYWPESRSIQYSALHDYDGFYKDEILDRKELGYPPFKKIIRIISEDKNLIKAKKDLSIIANLLKEKNIDSIGPAPCFLSKINNKFRFHIIIKTDKWPNSEIREIFYSNPYLTWDVEPTNLL